MRNRTIFEQNVLHALAGAADEYGASEETLNEAEELFMRFAPRDRLRAESAALEWVAIAGNIKHGAAAAERVFLEQQKDNPHVVNREIAPEVVEFMRQRHANLRIPQRRA